jgi:hypothetical protein
MYIRMLDILRLIPYPYQYQCRFQYHIHHITFGITTMDGTTGIAQPLVASEIPCMGRKIFSFSPPSLLSFAFFAILIDNLNLSLHLW